MLEVSGSENQTVKTSMVPLNCTKGHPIYVMFFPDLKRYGFGCGLCHTLGLAITQFNQVLGLESLTAAKTYVPERWIDGLIGMGCKAVHVGCGPKKHNLMAIQFPEVQQFGFGCPHCKRYSLEFADHQGRLIEMRVLRSLDGHDKNVAPITNHPAFSMWDDTKITPNI